MSVNGFVKREYLNDDIQIEYKPPPADLHTDRMVAPANRTTILTKNEVNFEDIGMEINIDDMPLETLVRPCHVVRISPSTTKPFACNFCPKTFALKAYLNTHLRRHTQEKTFPCDECPKKFICQNYLNKHFRSVHSRPFVCDECPEKFRIESMLKKHSKTHELFWTKTRTYECYICTDNKRIFLKIGGLTDHMRSRHSSERPFACDQCPKTFAVKSYLTSHKANHLMRERVYACDRCDKKYCTKRLLAQHKKTHLALADKPFKCAKCPKAFLIKTDLSRHIRTNSCKRITHLPKGTMIQCYICSKERKTFYLMREHMLLTHLRNHSKRYACDECPKRYTMKEHLRYHKRSNHRKERPFTCSLCSKSFSSKSYLASTAWSIQKKSHSFVQHVRKHFRICRI